MRLPYGIISKIRMTAMIICPARFYTVVLVDSQTSPFSGFALNDMGWFSDKWILSV
jgi:hypothetical protein